MTTRVGIDSGGTFTDAVSLSNDGTIGVAKVPSTPDDPAQATIEAFGRALRGIPATSANNAGLDSTELMTQLRAAHAAAPGASCHGVDVIKGAAGDMKEAGIFEAFKVKAQILSSATEATEMILRVDDVIKCAPRQREG